ncbi:hypothetical protein Pfo_017575 [Paulownia fortunei]|nr:hypothetical protein Pfo_017575 [Paulownia fortunei]
MQKKDIIFFEGYKRDLKSTKQVQTHEEILSPRILTQMSSQLCRFPRSRYRREKACLESVYWVPKEEKVRLSEHDLARMQKQRTDLAAVFSKKAHEIKRGWKRWRRRRRKYNKGKLIVCYPFGYFSAYEQLTIAKKYNMFDNQYSTMDARLKRERGICMPGIQECAGSIFGTQTLMGQNHRWKRIEMN